MSFTRAAYGETVGLGVGVTVGVVVAVCVGVSVAVGRGVSVGIGTEVDVSVGDGMTVGLTKNVATEVGSGVGSISLWQPSSRPARQTRFIGIAFRRFPENIAAINLSTDALKKTLESGRISGEQTRKFAARG